MTVSPTQQEDLLRLLPNLRAFAISLAGRPDLADDLVQETITKAWAKFDTFQEGTNLKAWLFTILRNEFYTYHRRQRREVQDSDGKADQLVTHAEQHGHMNLEDFKKALGRVSEDQREALILVGASGFSYEEAAEICGVAVGTIKSRVNRARNRLCELLYVKSMDEFGPDEASRAVEGVNTAHMNGTVRPWR